MLRAMASERPRSWNATGRARFLTSWLRPWGLHPGASWGLAWVALFSGGMIAEAQPQSAAAWVAAFVLIGLFPALTVVGALGFAGRRAPIGLIPAGVAIGVARAALFLALGPAPAHGLALATEPAAELAAAVILAGAALLRPVPPLRFALVGTLALVALLDGIDAWTSMAGARPDWIGSAWLGVGPLAALLQLAAMGHWIARRELRIENAEDERRALTEELALRERAEALLRESEAWLFDFYEKAPDMLLALSPGSCEILRCNRKFCECLGYARRELIGRPLLDLVDEAERPGVRAALADLAPDRSHQRRALALGLRRRNGSRIDVLATLALRPGPRGGAPQVRAILHDVTAPRRGGAERPVDERLHRLLAAHAPAGLFYADAEGRCLFANRRFHELSGLTPEGVAEPGWLDRLHPDGGETLLDAWRAATRPWRARRSLRLASGRENLVQIECVALRGADGEVTGFAGSLALLETRRGGVAPRKEDAIAGRRAGGAGAPF
jgi:PAS domain S-box-containing protein